MRQIDALHAALVAAGFDANEAPDRFDITTRFFLDGSFDIELDAADATQWENLWDGCRLTICRRGSYELKQRAMHVAMLKLHAAGILPDAPCANWRDVIAAS